MPESGWPAEVENEQNGAWDQRQERDVCGGPGQLGARRASKQPCDGGDHGRSSRHSPEIEIADDQPLPVRAVDDGNVVVAGTRYRSAQYWLIRKTLAASIGTPIGERSYETVPGCCHYGRSGGGDDIQSRQAGTSWEIERVRRPVKHEHRVQATDAAGAAKLIVPVESSLVQTLFFQRRDPFPPRLSQLPDRSKSDRTGRAGGGASRSKPSAQSVVAEGALVRPTVRVIELRNAEGTRGDAVPTAIADIILDDHAPEFSADDGAGRTRIQATGMNAMLADVAEHEPGQAIPGWPFDERHVSPGGGSEIDSVVITVSVNANVFVGESPGS